MSDLESPPATQWNAPAIIITLLFQLFVQKLSCLFIYYYLFSYLLLSFLCYFTNILRHLLDLR